MSVQDKKVAVLTGAAKARLAEIRAGHRLRKADDPASAEARAEYAARQSFPEMILENLFRVA